MQASRGFVFPFMITPGIAAISSPIFVSTSISPASLPTSNIQYPISNIQYSMSPPRLRHHFPLLAHAHHERRVVAHLDFE